MKRVLLSLVAIVLVAGAILGLRHYLHSLGHQSTDNAQIDGTIIPLSAEVPGRVLTVNVHDNQTVHKGDLLVELDPGEYKRKLEQAERALAALKTREKAAWAQVELTRAQGDASVAQGESGVTAAQATISAADFGVEASRQQAQQARAQVAVAQANLERASTEVTVAAAESQRLADDSQRYQALYARSEVSRQQLEQVATLARQAQARLIGARRAQEAARGQVDQARAAAAAAQDQVRLNQAQRSQAEARTREAEGRLQSAQTAPRQVEVARAQAEVIRSEIKQAQSAVDLARLDLERTRILAPADGTVARKTIESGSYVPKGGLLMALVPTQVWVVANFKETQMAGIIPGKKAEIRVDTYPDKVFTARVESIQAGTGARFSLLPPENAAGSFVKVVQRIPVKIVFDPPPSEETPLRPGMSVEAQVTL